MESAAVHFMHLLQSSGALYHFIARLVGLQHLILIYGLYTKAGRRAVLLYHILRGKTVGLLPPCFNL